MIRTLNVSFFRSFWPLFLFLQNRPHVCNPHKYPQNCPNLLPPPICHCNPVWLAHVTAVSVGLVAFVCIECFNMPQIKPAFCQRVSLQFLLVTSLCVIDYSVREWDVAVAMLTLGKICTADVTKEIRCSFAGAAVFSTAYFLCVSSLHIPPPILACLAVF